MTLARGVWRGEHQRNSWAVLNQVTDRGHGSNYVDGSIHKAF